MAALAGTGYMRRWLALVFCSWASTAWAGGDPEVYSGISNVNSGYGSVILGGRYNTILGTALESGVLGGDYNKVESESSVVVGGEANYALGASTELETVIGGEFNRAQSKLAVVVGGRTNRAKSRYSAVGGGYNNLATGRFSAIPGGSANTVHGKYSVALGSFSNILGDYSLMINLLGTRTAMTAENTIQMHVTDVYVNDHNVGEVYASSSRRHRQLRDNFHAQVHDSSTTVLHEHSKDQSAILSDKIARLRDMVSGMSQEASTALSHIRSGRAVQAEAASKVDLTANKLAAETVHHARRLFAELDEKFSDVDVKTSPTHERADESNKEALQTTTRFLRSYYGADEVGSQPKSSPSPHSRFPAKTLLRSGSNANRPGPQHGMRATKPSRVTNAHRRLERAKHRWYKTELHRRKRRRLVNEDSDYPKDGTMATAYQESLTARMDDIESRITSLDSRVSTHQTYYDGGYLVGDFDCENPPAYHRYGEGPCNICGAVPRIQFRDLDPVSASSVVLVCDGQGTETEYLDVVTNGNWLTLS